MGSRLDFRELNTEFIRHSRSIVEFRPGRKKVLIFSYIYILKSFPPEFHHPRERVFQFTEVEDFAQLFIYIMNLLGVEFDAHLLCRRHFRVEVGDVGVGIYGIWADRGFKGYTLEGAASGQGHIDLAEGERRTCVNDDLIESQALTLVDSDGPGYAQRYLTEDSEDLRLDFSRLFIQRVLGVLPIYRSYIYHIAVFIRNGDQALCYV